MSLVSFSLALTCVLAICAGQLLFKRVSNELASAGTWMNGSVLSYGILALAIYAAATLLWIHVLRDLDLSRAYPIMALSFVVVPLASAWLYGDRLSGPYFVGVILICAGVAVISTVR